MNNTVTTLTYIYIYLYNDENSKNSIILFWFCQNAQFVDLLTKSIVNIILRNYVIPGGVCEIFV